MALGVALVTNMFFLPKLEKVPDFCFCISSKNEPRIFPKTKKRFHFNEAFRRSQQNCRKTKGVNLNANIFIIEIKQRNLSKNGLLLEKYWNNLQHV